MVGLRTSQPSPASAAAAAAASVGAVAVWIVAGGGGGRGVVWVAGGARGVPDLCPAAACLLLPATPPLPVPTLNVRRVPSPLPHCRDNRKPNGHPVPGVRRAAASGRCPPVSQLRPVSCSQVRGVHAAQGTRGWSRCEMVPSAWLWVSEW